MRFLRSGGKAGSCCGHQVVDPTCCSSEFSSRKDLFQVRQGVIAPDFIELSIRCFIGRFTTRGRAHQKLNGNYL